MPGERCDARSRDGALLCRAHVAASALSAWLAFQWLPGAPGGQPLSPLGADRSPCRLFLAGETLPVGGGDGNSVAVAVAGRRGGARATGLRRSRAARERGPGARNWGWGWRRRRRSGCAALSPPMRLIGWRSGGTNRRGRHGDADAAQPPGCGCRLWGPALGLPADARLCRWAGRALWPGAASRRAPRGCPASLLSDGSMAPAASVPVGAGRAPRLPGSARALRTPRRAAAGRTPAGRSSSAAGWPRRS